MTQYKFLLDGMISRYGDLQWRIGEWQQVIGILAMCGNGLHCSATPYDAICNVQGDVIAEVIAEVETHGEHIDDDDKSCWRRMRLVRAWRWGKTDSIALETYAAELVLPIWEQVYPDDLGPRLAITAARDWLDCPCDEHAETAKKAARAAPKGNVDTIPAIASWAAVAALHAANSAYLGNIDTVIGRRAVQAAKMASMDIQPNLNAWMLARISELEEIKQEGE